MRQLSFDSRPVSSIRTIITFMVQLLNHYGNTPMQYTENVFVVKMKIVTGKFLIFFLFLLGEAVLTSTHNTYFGAKIRKIGIPLHTPVLLYESGV